MARMPRSLDAYAEWGARSRAMGLSPEECQDILEQEQGLLINQWDMFFEGYWNTIPTDQVMAEVFHQAKPAPVLTSEFGRTK